MRRSEGFLEALTDFAGALVPLATLDIQREIDAKLREIPNLVNRYGYDPYGMSPDWMRRWALPALMLYRYYFRVETSGIERVPDGRLLIVSNHAGQLPFDTLMLSIALLLEADPPRIARPMGEYWIPQIPVLSVAAARGGALVGTPENCIHMLENEECVTVFPEGARGMNKTYARRYQLQRFGRGFMRLALKTNTPILPVGIVGSEEQQPGVTDLKRVAKLFGIPSFPITLGFPWLGPLGLLPMPVKYRIHFGEPMRFDGTGAEDDASISRRVDDVKDLIGVQLEEGLRERAGVFR